jgi:hypothetical protein
MQEYSREVLPEKEPETQAVVLSSDELKYFAIVSPDLK